MEYIDAVLGAYEPLSEDVFRLKMKRQVTGGAEESYTDIKSYIDAHIIGGKPERESETITRDDYDNGDIFLVTPIDLDNPLASGPINDISEAVLDIIGGDLEDDNPSFDTPPIESDDSAAELAGMFNQFKL